ncbi:P-loop containing nucleoside triphosphate hydrolase protein [Pisolithus marmoratus]|nr:P-loop containing nucleoside triphosphate hydrolase protein [Pisolithus marmoratus]
MLTVKLVVLGSSGVGKTSLRGQYLSGRFSTGYRATIGADFIAKTLPHPTRHGEFVSLQIWDTAGQERFSRLTSAFYRGADAVILMFDVNRPESLTSLTKWWSEFRERAPLSDEEIHGYCCVVVGNKIDLVDPDSVSFVSEAETSHFIEQLVPRLAVPPFSTTEEGLEAAIELPEDDSNDLPPEGDINISFTTARSKHIDIDHRRTGSLFKSRSQSRSVLNGTVSSTHTGKTSFHTPSSSLFDAYATARSSPWPSSRSPSPTRGCTPRRMSSQSSTSSTATVTPSLFTRAHEEAATPPTPPLLILTPEHTPTFPPRPDSRPRVFFTSAKTGRGVSDVFEYIARRVVMKWEYEEAMDALTFHAQDTMSTAEDTIQISRNAMRWPSSNCCGQ